jgi:hypothetical protein
MKTDTKTETKEKDQLPKQKPKFTTNELSLAAATGLEPSSDLIKHFAKTYPEPKADAD